MTCRSCGTDIDWHDPRKPGKNCPGCGAKLAIDYGCISCKAKLESEEILFRCPKCNSPGIQRAEVKGEVLLDFAQSQEKYLSALSQTPEIILELLKDLIHQWAKAAGFATEYGKMLQLMVNDPDEFAKCFEEARKQAKEEQGNGPPEK